MVRSDLETFAFGRNWASFLTRLNEQRINEAERSLLDMLGRPSLAGLSFLDAGCGSGLFSLAARRAGARVHSFDVDADSVACATELRRRLFNDDPDWLVERGSVLDDRFILSLGEHDIVYSWGVLHHTGAMWRAMENVLRCLGPGGRFFVAIYNDQGMRSRLWRIVKRTYNRLPAPLRGPYAIAVMLPREALMLAAYTASLRPRAYLRSWTHYHQTRGMSRWHDMLDWVGGYPFEVARPEEVFDFCRERGLRLARLRTCGGGLGCNEFVFERG